MVNKLDSYLALISVVSGSNIAYDKSQYMWDALIVYSEINSLNLLDLFGV